MTDTVALAKPAAVDHGRSEADRPGALLGEVGAEAAERLQVDRRRVATGVAELGPLVDDVEARRRLRVARRQEAAERCSAAARLGAVGAEVVDEVDPAGRAA